MLPNGQMGIYDKRHLFGYAGEDNEFTPGTKRLIASVKGWKINLLVCYDLRFPVWARQQVQEEGPEYDLLDLCCQLARKKKPCLENFAAGKGYRKSMLCCRSKSCGL